MYSRRTQEWMEYIDFIIWDIFACLRKESSFAHSVRFLDEITHHKLALEHRLLSTTKEDV